MNTKAKMLIAKAEWPQNIGSALNLLIRGGTGNKSYCEQPVTVPGCKTYPPSNVLHLMPDNRYNS